MRVAPPRCGVLRTRRPEGAEKSAEHLLSPARCPAGSVPRMPLQIPLKETQIREKTQNNPPTSSERRACQKLDLFSNPRSLQSSILSAKLARRKRKHTANPVQTHLERVANLRALDCHKGHRLGITATLARRASRTPRKSENSRLL